MKFGLIVQNRNRTLLKSMKLILVIVLKAICDEFLQEYLYE